MSRNHALATLPADPQVTDIESGLYDSHLDELQCAVAVPVKRMLEVEDADAEVVVELPGTFRPVAGVSIRLTPEHGTQLVVQADL